MRRADIRFGAVRLLLCLFAAILLLLSGASAENADLPKGLKNAYRYDTQDDSIVLIRRRLVELGYMPEDQAEITWANNTLKKAVIAFQQDHGLDPDGRLDMTLFSVLFSSSADSQEQEQESGNGPAAALPVNTAASAPPRETAAEMPAGDGSEGKLSFGEALMNLDPKLLFAAGVIAVIALVSLCIRVSARRRMRERSVPPNLRTGPAAGRQLWYESEALRARTAPAASGSPAPQEYRIARPVIGPDTEKGKLSRISNTAPDEWIFTCGSCKQEIRYQRMDSVRTIRYICPRCGKDNPVSFGEPPEDEAPRKEAARPDIRTRIPHYDDEDEYECSACGRRFPMDFMNCPHCGVRFTALETDMEEYLREEKEAEEAAERAEEEKNTRYGTRIFIPHYEDPDEYQCSVCGKRFREKEGECPYCGAVFSDERKNGDEYDEELEDVLEEDDWYDEER